MMNGTMEEVKEPSPPQSPASGANIKLDGNEQTLNNCENSNMTENSNHLEDSSSQDPLASSNAELSTNENSNDVESDDKVESDHKIESDDKIESDNKMESDDKIKSENINASLKDDALTGLSHENSNNGQDENNCSNDSFTESVSSLQVKFENDDIKKISSLNLTVKKSLINDKVEERPEESDELDSEEDSTDGSEDPSEAVSVKSDTVDDNSQLDKSKLNNSDVIIIENENGDEVHEIESDNEDCVVAKEVKVSKSKITPMRRSSRRSIKRKKYNEEYTNGDDESDVEEVELEDPLKHMSRPIFIKDTKNLLEMTKKSQNHQKKEPTVVIIDSKSNSNKLGLSKNLSLNAQHLYQSMVARGTTVTPVSSKNVSAQNNSTHQTNNQPTPVVQPPILPSLTDDMFVVEAPSFIVPYVYEKPSLKPFREFIDKLGKEIEEERAKKEKERIEKEKDEKLKHDKEKQDTEKQDKNKQDIKDELPEESENDKEKPSEVPEEKKSSKKEKKRRKNVEDDDKSWDGSSSESEEDEILSDEEGTTVVIKDKADIDENEVMEVADLTADKIITAKSDNYFDCQLGKFFVDIGLNLVQEFVQNDLLKQQNRKLNKEKKSGQPTKSTLTSIASLMKNLEFSKENNSPYSFPQKKCDLCSFKTESTLIMTHHKETPHMINNMYKCNYCSFEIKSPHDILFHMEAEHNTKGKLERAPAYHQCANCPFEDNGKGKLARHLIACGKKFKPEQNLAPPVDWEPPAKIPKLTKPKNSVLGNYQMPYTRGPVGSTVRAPMNIANMMQTGGFKARGRSPMAIPSQQRPLPVQGIPIARAGLLNNTKLPTVRSAHSPSISITPLPRHPQPSPTQAGQQSNKTFVICEICDGYIKDLEQLRNHMQWIHKVKIHPKMIYNRPPLNCQKCQFRFFTDQGLERHLLGTHGLVTSSMQEAANKGKDAGRCPVCGRVYQWKLLNHVARDHNVTLKPAHLSYKCTVCTATFGMYKLFENHVYSAHSVVAKKVMDKNKVLPPKPNDAQKPMKINDEITIIPQSAKSSKK